MRIEDMPLRRSVVHAPPRCLSRCKGTAPNGLDYYPQGPEAMERAEKEHHDRLRRIDQVKEELDSLAQAIEGSANG